MIPTSLLLLSAVFAGADPDVEQVHKALSDHFATIKSVRVRGVERVIKSGGLWVDDPVGSKIVYDTTRETREFDVWFAPPKQRVYTTETSPAADGTKGRALRRATPRAGERVQERMT